MEIEQIAFTMIVHAGNARSLCFEALRAVQENKFDEAADNLSKVKAELAEAHHIQTNMLQKEAAGEKQEVNLLMVHAQDHLMCAILAKDMAEQMIPLYEMQAQLQKTLAAK
jgi:PTS system cellobiose-specific IIA component